LNGALLRDFYAYASSVTAGVRVGAADVDGDGRADIITGTGPGSAAIVRVFSGASGLPLRDFYAFTPSYQGGVFVAGGDINGDHLADLFVGTDIGASEVRIFSGGTASLLRDLYPYGPQFLGGVRVAATDVNNDGLAELLVGAGIGGSPHVKRIDPRSLIEQAS